MEIRPITLPVGPDRTIHASLGVPRSTTRDGVLVLAHGANNSMDQPLIKGLHELLARAGLVTVRFNFPYVEAGRKHPDPDDALEGVFRLVLEYVAQMDEFKGLALYLGGKSMGARLAAQIVAKDVGASGLVFLGYPLHSPGQAGKTAGSTPVSTALPGPVHRGRPGPLLPDGPAGKSAGADAGPERSPRHPRGGPFL